MSTKTDQAGSELPGRSTRGRRKRGGSLLVEETRSMERKRRAMEQEGERRLARVHAKERPEEAPPASPEGELQNDILQHPVLDSPRYDGSHESLAVAPSLSSEAGTKFMNDKRDQDREKQNRLENNLGLGNSPKYSRTPRPPGM